MSANEESKDIAWRTDVMDNLVEQELLLRYTHYLEDEWGKSRSINYTIDSLRDLFYEVHEDLREVSIILRADRNHEETSKTEPRLGGYEACSVVHSEEEGRQFWRHSIGDADVYGTRERSETCAYDPSTGPCSDSSQA